MRHLRVRIGILVIAVMLQTRAEAGPILINGDFETGDFTGWTLSDPLDPSVVTSAGTIGGINYVPHSGTFFAALAESGVVGKLSQTVTTTPGQLYTLTYFMGSDSTFTGGAPDAFGASWDSTVLFPTQHVPSTIVAGTVEYKPFTFTVTGTGSDTLTFFERNDFGFQVLDDVSLTPATGPVAPEPASLILVSLGTAILAVYGWKRRGKPACGISSAY
jgi:hypothetical protein